VLLGAKGVVIRLGTVAVVKLEERREIRDTYTPLCKCSCVVRDKGREPLLDTVCI
jgi:hypothetical protein